MGRVAVSVVLAGLLSSCMSLHLKAPQIEEPVSFNAHLPGPYQSRFVRHFSREIWVYHVFGLPQWPLGTREGIAYEDLLSRVLSEQLSPQQGITRLKIRHQHTVFTFLAAGVSLGALSPTAVIIEGDIVELIPQ